MNRVEEYRNLVRANSRAKFIEICPYPFLLGMPQLSRPSQPGKTILVSQQDRDALLAPLRKRRPSTETALIVLPVRKVQEAFPSMITVGRTSNNDVVIEDVQVSKFHAFFRINGDQLELADAGSRNGTFIGKLRLEAKGAARPVRQGETIRFGHLEFVFLDSGACWDRLRA
jgi:FHA domain